MTVTDDVPTAPPRPRRTARNAAIVVGVVMVGLIVLLATRGTNEGVSSQLVGQAAPPVEGVTLDGETFDLARHRGEWVFVNFFASWCLPCRVEHPELVAFADEHRDDPVQVVSVGYSDQPDAIRQFFAEEGGDWPVIPEGTGRIALEYGLSGVPETFVVAPNGLVVTHLKGAQGVTQAQLNSVIERSGGLEATTGIGG